MNLKRPQLTSIDGVVLQCQRTNRKLTAGEKTDIKYNGNPLLFGESIPIYEITIRNGKDHTIDMAFKQTPTFNKGAKVKYTAREEEIVIGSSAKTHVQLHLASQDGTQEHHLGILQDRQPSSVEKELIYQREQSRRRYAF